MPRPREFHLVLGVMRATVLLVGWRVGGFIHQTYLVEPILVQTPVSAAIPVDGSKPLEIQGVSLGMTRQEVESIEGPISQGFPAHWFHGSDREHPLARVSFGSDDRVDDMAGYGIFQGTNRLGMNGQKMDGVVERLGAPDESHPYPDGVRGELQRLHHGSVAVLVAFYTVNRGMKWVNHFDGTSDAASWGHRPWFGEKMGTDTNSGRIGVCPHFPSSDSSDCSRSMAPPWLWIRRSSPSPSRSTAAPTGLQSMPERRRSRTCRVSWRCGVDGTLVYLAEEVGTTDILTLDLRGFQTYRIGRRHFTIAP